MMHKAFYHLLPPLCVLCGCGTGSSASICSGCLQALPSLSHSCQRCAQFLAVGEALICGTCLNNPPPHDVVYALSPYQPPVEQLIIQLKFRHKLSIALALGKLLSAKIQTTWYVDRALPQLIIPIPLHPYRLRERGFNQALEIARPIAKACSLPLDSHGVTRIRHTEAQSGLPAAQRKRNIANAFAVHRDYSGLSVAVVDDVITTGSTLAEFCRAIKQNGAKRIDVWCCARRDVALKAKTS